jgi:NitT/TauT family transport system permease protein
MAQAHEVALSVPEEPRDRSDVGGKEAQSWSGGKLLRTIFTSGVLYAVVSLIVVLAIMQLVVTLAHVPVYILPEPTNWLRVMVDQHDILWPQSLTTLTEVLIGLGVAIGIGVPLAVVVALSGPIEKVAYPLLVTSQVIPVIAVAPLLLVWFGYGILPKVVVVVLVAIFPIVLNGVAGLRSLEMDKVHLARSMGAGRLGVLWSFRLPNALPSLFTGFKLAATYSVTGAIVGEFVGSHAGLGYVMITANGSLNVALVLAAIAYLTIMGILLFFSVVLIERITVPWSVALRKMES